MTKGQEVNKRMLKEIVINFLLRKRKREKLIARVFGRNPIFAVRLPERIAATAIRFFWRDLKGINLDSSGHYKYLLWANYVLLRIFRAARHERIAISLC